MTFKPTDKASLESIERPDWMNALIALRMAKAQVIEEHCKSGHPIVIWHDGKVYLQPPEEAKLELEKAIKDGSWFTLAGPAR
jgi:hypothetical protein